MKRNSRPVAVLCLLVLSLASLPALAALPDSPAIAPPASLAVVLGGIPRTMPHCDAHVISLEFERALSEKNALVLRASGVPYHYNDGAYLENGRINGLDIGARHYRGAGLSGLYAGASLGYWTSDWAFMRLTDPGRPQGTARSVSARLDLEFGDRIMFDDTGFFLTPQVNLGRFFSSRSCTYTGPASLAGMPCSQNSEVRGYWFVGLGVGVMF